MCVTFSYIFLCFTSRNFYQSEVNIYKINSCILNAESIVRHKINQTTNWVNPYIGILLRGSLTKYIYSYEVR